MNRDNPSNQQEAQRKLERPGAITGLELGELARHLDFSTVPDLWPELARRIASARELEVSLRGVTRANSAGLALLLEGIELANRKSCRLRYRDIPADLLALARMSNVEALLLGEQPPTGTE